MADSNAMAADDGPGIHPTWSQCSEIVGFATMWFELIVVLPTFGARRVGKSVIYLWYGSCNKKFFRTVSFWQVSDHDSAQILIRIE
jgi:hypothetical protein